MPVSKSPVIFSMLFLCTVFVLILLGIYELGIIENFERTQFVLKLRKDRSCVMGVGGGFGMGSYRFMKKDDIQSTPKACDPKPETIGEKEEGPAPNPPAPIPKELIPTGGGQQSRHRPVLQPSPIPANPSEQACKDMVVSSPSDLLAKHNCYRRIHGFNDLQWSSILENMAKQSPNRCKNKHDHGNIENLAKGQAAGGVDRWYNEIKCFDVAKMIGKPGCQYSDGNGCRTGTCYGHVKNILEANSYVGCDLALDCQELRCKYI